MRLNSLKLLNFRNYEDVFIELSPGVNVFIGDNGVGKTNILEGIYVLSLTKSGRYGSDSDLIKKNFSNLSIIGEVSYGDYIKKYQISIDKYGKRVYINNSQIKKYLSIYLIFV